MWRRAMVGFGVVLGLFCASACSPVLDWRVITLGADAQLQFPCKPDRLERQVPVLDRAVPAQMLVCDAGGLSWSVTVFELGDPAQAAAALRELPHKLLLNMSGTEAVLPPATVAGKGGAVIARRSRIDGVRPDGSPAAAQTLFAARGSRVYQLVAMTRSDAPEQWPSQADEFLDALRWQN